jgi:hypothetical protein
MDVINKSHGCAKKIISSRYCYTARILPRESYFIFEAFKHHCNRPFHSPLEGIGIVFLHHLSFLPLYEEKRSQLGNSRSLPRRKRGLISPYLSIRCFSYQSIDPLVAICWSFFYFHGSKFIKLSNIYFLVVFSCIFFFHMCLAYLTHSKTFVLFTRII